MTARQRALAATFWNGGVVSHATAGRLLQLDGVKADGLHLTVRYEQGFAHDEMTIHRTRTLPDGAGSRHGERAADGTDHAHVAATAG